ncbi:Uncharacterised protein [Yersinia frederiksenii]|nr:Uncharacterised protein [Yersinia frederiksenii]
MTIHASSHMSHTRSRIGQRLCNGTISPRRAISRYICAITANKTNDKIRNRVPSGIRYHRFYRVWSTAISQCVIGKHSQCSGGNRRGTIVWDKVNRHTLTRTI